METLKSSAIWLPAYLKQLTRRPKRQPRQVYFSVCDHFEPYNRNADAATANRRIQKWLRHYPGIASRYLDSDGNWLRYSFFYPQEQYRETDLDLLALLCREGFGEVEVHLHHDGDSSGNLRRTLLDFKRTLHEKHGLLPLDRHTGEICYGFIHGNWALGNCRRDGRYCGVDDEITILRDTGCYADFTLPSAPSPTQTRKINSIYHAVDDPLRLKPHDDGINVRAGGSGNGLLMVQGPLGLDWRRRKFGVLPRLENGGLLANLPVTRSRVRSWLRQRICVAGSEEAIFVKLYNHGAYDEMSEAFLEGGGLAGLLGTLTEVCAEQGLLLHFVTAREMVNVILGLEQGLPAGSDFSDFRYVLRR